MIEYRTYHIGRPIGAAQKEQVLALMREAFPPTERRTDEAQRALFAHPLYRVHTVEEDRRVLAFMAAWSLQEMTFFEHFAVDSALRSQGLGGKFLDHLLSGAPQPAVLEVELPEDELTRRRIGFYQRHGLFLNERFYQQLPLRPGDSPTPMFLMSFPRALSDAEFLRVRREIYRHVYETEI